MQGSSVLSPAASTRGEVGSVLSPAASTRGEVGRDGLTSGSALNSRSSRSSMNSSAVLDLSRKAPAEKDQAEIGLTIIGAENRDSGLILAGLTPDDSFLDSSSSASWRFENLQQLSAVDIVADVSPLCVWNPHKESLSQEGTALVVGNSPSFLAKPDSEKSLRPQVPLGSLGSTTTTAQSREVAEPGPTGRQGSAEGSQGSQGNDRLEYSSNKRTNETNTRTSGSRRLSNFARKH